jgi:hypothetical protein
MKAETNDYEHSFEIQELIGKAPSWTAYWGITALTIILFFLIVVCSLIKLPVTEQYQGFLELTNPPLYIINKENTVIKTNSELMVKAGDLIAYNKNDKTMSIEAPYDGKLNIWKHGKTGINDTVYVLTPAKVNYVLEGIIPIKYVNHVKENSTITFAISSDKLKNKLNLFGIIRNISPVSTNQELQLYADVNPDSNSILKSELMYSQNVRCDIEVQISDMSILDMITGKYSNDDL